ncbi:hypothetical protein ACK31G_02480, partial [Aeromonas caviae]
LHAETALGTGRMTSTFECSKKWGDYHWIGQYKKTKENGKIIVYIERPVCLRSADYLSKTLNTNIGRGRNFKFIGLEGAKTRRRDMIKRAKEYRNQR